MTAAALSHRFGRATREPACQSLSRNFSPKQRRPSSRRSAASRSPPLASEGSRSSSRGGPSSPTRGGRSGKAAINLSLHLLDVLLVTPVLVLFTTALSTTSPRSASSSSIPMCGPARRPSSSRSSRSSPAISRATGGTGWSTAHSLGVARDPPQRHAHDVADARPLPPDQPATSTVLIEPAFCWRSASRPARLSSICRSPLLRHVHARRMCRRTFGPLGRVLVSPAMHRWHHARDASPSAPITPPPSRCSTSPSAPIGCRGLYGAARGVRGNGEQCRRPLRPPSPGRTTARSGAEATPGEAGRAEAGRPNLAASGGRFRARGCGVLPPPLRDACP